MARTKQQPDASGKRKKEEIPPFRPATGKREGIPPFRPATGNPRKSLASLASHVGQKKRPISYTPEGSPPPESASHVDQKKPPPSYTPEGSPPPESDDNVVEDSLSEDEDEDEADDYKTVETSFRGSMPVARYLVAKGQKPIVKVSIIDESGAKMGTLKGELLLKEDAHIWRDGQLQVETKVSLQDDVDSDDDIQPEPKKMKK